jgi:hypothetical protein
MYLKFRMRDSDKHIDWAKVLGDDWALRGPADGGTPAEGEDGDDEEGGEGGAAAKEAREAQIDRIKWQLDCERERAKKRARRHETYGWVLLKIFRRTY